MMSVCVYRSGRSPRVSAQGGSSGSSPKAAAGQSFIFRSSSVNHTILDEIVVNDLLVRSDKTKEARSPGPGQYNPASPLGSERRGFSFAVPAASPSANNQSGRSRGSGSGGMRASGSFGAGGGSPPGTPRLVPPTACMRGDVLFYRTEGTKNIDLLGPGSYSPSGRESPLIKRSFNARVQTPTRSRPGSASSPAPHNNTTATSSSGGRPRSGSAKRAPGGGSGSSSADPRSPTFSRAAFSPTYAARPSSIVTEPISPIFRDRAQQAARREAGGNGSSNGNYWNRYETPGAGQP